MALLLALSVSTVLLTVGIGFLAYLERDAYFQAGEELSSRAYYLALSGLKVFHYDDISFPNVVFPLDVTRTIDVSPTEHIDVIKKSSGVVQSRGYVTNTMGKVLASRTVCTPTSYPGGDLQGMYEVGQ
jgi:hypothetical protein